LSFPSLPLPSRMPPFPSSSIPLPSFPLEVIPLNPARNLGSAVRSPRGPGAEPQPKSNVVHFGGNNCRALRSLSSITFERNLRGQFSPSHARSPLLSLSLNFQPAPLRFSLRSRCAHICSNCYCYYYMYSDLITH